MDRQTDLAGRHRQPVAGEGLLVLEVPLEAALHVLHRKSAHRAAQDRVAWGREHPVKYPGNGENQEYYAENWAGREN